mmetsp:Transcript_41058/g.97429  ORF Transcript_41058/g.97429 Transcript_41058/m.97429 type:complete len:207 (-) Transcript_41058:93-713(-)
MRDTVAESITEEVFDLMKMYAEAGVEGFEWLRHHCGPRDLDEARAFAKRRGKDYGAGQCLWADEHALQSMATLAKVCILIFDEQAPSSGSRSGRRRGAADDGRPDSRFVCIREHSDKAVLLHRSRRQHYSPIFIGWKGVVDLATLPSRTRSLWPSLSDFSSTNASATETSQAPAAARAESGREETHTAEAEEPERKKHRASEDVAE